MSNEVATEYTPPHAGDSAYVQVSLLDLESEGESGAQLDGWIDRVNTHFNKILKEKGLDNEPTGSISSFNVTYMVETTPAIDELGEIAIEDLFNEAMRDAMDAASTRTREEDTHGNKLNQAQIQELKDVFDPPVKPDSQSVVLSVVEQEIEWMTVDLDDAQDLVKKGAHTLLKEIIEKVDAEPKRDTDDDNSWYESDILDLKMTVSAYPQESVDIVKGYIQKVRDEIDSGVYNEPKGLTR